MNQDHEHDPAPEPAGNGEHYDSQAAEEVRDDPFADDALDELGLTEGDGDPSVPPGAVGNSVEVSGHPDSEDSELLARPSDDSEQE